MALTFASALLSFLGPDWAGFLSFGCLRAIVCRRKEGTLGALVPNRNLSGLPPSSPRRHPPISLTHAGHPSASAGGKEFPPPSPSQEIPNEIDSKGRRVSLPFVLSGLSRFFLSLLCLDSRAYPSPCTSSSLADFVYRRPALEISSTTPSSPRPATFARPASPSRSSPNGIPSLNIEHSRTDSSTRAG
jgi:hypothetical protein